MIISIFAIEKINMKNKFSVLILLLGLAMFLSYYFLNPIFGSNVSEGTIDAFIIISVIGIVVSLSAALYIVTKSLSEKNWKGD